MEILIRYGTQQTIFFPVIKAGSTDFAVAADWTPAGTDCDLSKDGGTWTQATNTIAFITGAPMCSLVLSATETACTRLAIAVVDSATKAIEDQAIICSTIMSQQIEANQGIIIGEVDTATFTATTTQLEGFRLSPNTTEETTADHYNGRLILFTSGALLGQMSDITDYVLANSKEKFTYTALTEAPSDADRYVIL